jgi:fluoroquinolone transport system permease protein
MKRLMSAMRLDLVIQLRYSFLYAAIISIFVWVAVLLALPEAILTKALPAVVFFDIAVVGFYFISGLVIYDKGESTLYALLISPLRFWEYLSSKLITLTILAILLAIALVGITYGFDFNILLLVLGTALMSLIVLMVGFIAVCPFGSFSSYLIPSQLYAALLYLPLIDHIGLWSSPIFYVLPTQGALRLMSGAFEPIQRWEIVYALLYGLLWIAILGMISSKMFKRYVIVRQRGE